MIQARLCINYESISKLGEIKCQFLSPGDARDRTHNTTFPS
jgi:hypothetical protein